MATILVTAASIHPDAVQMLSDYRLVFAGAETTEAELADIAAREHPVAILVRYGKISEKIIAAAGPGLKVISKHGVGTDNIDKAAAAARGIPVMAALGSNSQAVAEHAIALMLSCARKVVWLDGRVKAGNWDKDSYQGFELAGSTLGLIGLGSIGSRVAKIASAIGQNVLIHDPFAKLDGLPVKAATLEALLQQSDVISLHCPLTPETHHVLGRERLAMLKPGAIVINTARAELIDEVALFEALHEGRVSAGIDCFIDEPLQAGSNWFKAPNVVLTPHIGGTTGAAMRAMGIGAAKHIIEHLHRSSAHAV